MVESLFTIIEQLHAVGMRRLVVLSGNDAWVEQQLQQLQHAHCGDWLTISPSLSQGIVPEKAHLLLGREFLHGIFDARQGFHSEALAMQAGTLKAGSLLVLCTVPQSEWATNNDIDSLRWNEQQGVIATPNFVHHLQQTFQSSPDILFYQQGDSPNFSLLEDKPLWQAPTGFATEQQQQIISQLLSADRGVWGLIAPRGRGKSAIAGMFIKQFSGECWCCAPAKAATEVLMQHAGKAVDFWSPDNLLAYCLSNQKITADWLIIDEAAAIPSYILRQLVRYFPRVLLTTTVDGYEGTGRGFILKFCATLPHFTQLQLNDPVRFARNDSLESWVNQALLLQEPTNIIISENTVKYCTLTQASLAKNNEKLKYFYGLLMSAHYRTSPLDLRRLLDAQHQHFIVAQNDADESKYLGALWMVDEGQLSESLSWQIWAGLRRPRGNLVVQSLAAHSYFPNAAQWQSRRVMRIAVDVNHRRQEIGLTLLAQQRLTATQQGLDFLSVSFGLTPDLLAFWLKAGFRLMRIGSHKEASSGCFTAMAILPISRRASQLCEQGEYQLARDLYWRNDLSELTLPINNQQQLTAHDWVTLIGFSEFNRPISASHGAIMRLLAENTVELPLLRRHLQQSETIAQICVDLGMTGQKQWLKLAREELGAWIKQQHAELIVEIKQKITASYL